MMKKVLTFYFVGIHLVLAFVIVKSNFIYLVGLKLGINHDEISGHFREMVAYHLRVDKNVPKNSTVFLGDSHIQGLAVSAVTSFGVNYGIGGDTTAGLLERLPIYDSLNGSKAVVIEIGFNDLGHRNNDEITDNFKTILAQLPNRNQVILCAVHPVGLKKHKRFNRRISELNESLEKLSLDHANVTFLNTFKNVVTPVGYLPSEYLVSDGIHLSKEGYDMWIKMIEKALK